MSFDIEQKSKGFRDKKIIFLILISVLLLGYSLMDLMKPSLVIQKKEFYSRVIVSDHPGVEINGTDLAFGMISPGGSSKKKITLNNDYDCDVKVNIYSEGEISEFIELSDNDFILLNNYEQEIIFLLKMPVGAEMKTYEGKITVVIRKIN